MNYFIYNKLLYHCDKVFNWIAIDKDGLVTLFEKEPFCRLEEGYWTSGHTDSKDMFFRQPDIPCSNWAHTKLFIGEL